MVRLLVMAMRGTWWGQHAMRGRPARHLPCALVRFQELVVCVELAHIGHVVLCACDACYE